MGFVTVSKKNRLDLPDLEYIMSSGSRDDKVVYQVFPKKVQHYILEPSHRGSYVYYWLIAKAETADYFTVTIPNFYADDFDSQKIRMSCFLDLIRTPQSGVVTIAHGDRVDFEHGINYTFFKISDQWYIHDGVNPAFRVTAHWGKYYRAPSTNSAYNPERTPCIWHIGSTIGNINNGSFGQAAYNRELYEALFYSYGNLSQIKRLIASTSQVNILNDGVIYLTAKKPGITLAEVSVTFQNYTNRTLIVQVRFESYNAGSSPWLTATLAKNTTLVRTFTNSQQCYNLKVMVWSADNDSSLVRDRPIREYLLHLDQARNDGQAWNLYWSCYRDGQRVIAS